MHGPLGLGLPLWASQAHHWLSPSPQSQSLADLIGSCQVSPVRTSPQQPGFLEFPVCHWLLRAHMTSSSRCCNQSRRSCLETPKAAEAMQGRGGAGSLGIATLCGLELGASIGVLFLDVSVSSTRSSGWLREFSLPVTERLFQAQYHHMDDVFEEL